MFCSHVLNENLNFKLPLTPVCARSTAGGSFLSGLTLLKGHSTCRAKDDTFEVVHRQKNGTFNGWMRSPHIGCDLLVFGQELNLPPKIRDL